MFLVSIDQNASRSVVIVFGVECRAISMGQGQEVQARRLTGQCRVSGGWVLLQNCHLSLDYVVELMDQLLDTDTIHEDFRLWVTTEVHPKFPIGFLQVGLVSSVYWQLWLGVGKGVRPVTEVWHFTIQSGLNR